MERGRVLVVDDKENMLELLREALSGEHEVTTAPDGARALSLVAGQEFDVVISDVCMPGADGFEVLRAVKQSHRDTEVVLMTAHATVQSAVEAMKLGAYDYLVKPFDVDQAAEIIGRALESKRLQEAAHSQRHAQDGASSFQGLVGGSEPMHELYALLAHAASLDITVLLTGETGSGKELAAQAIHAASRRAGRKFVPVNCGALPAELIESELFGHARGAFTGAVGAKPGLFEEAQGGTLFLDEIGELPLPMQVKLNRVLQEKEIRRVGENTPLPVDVRVIAATHRNLKSEVQTGHFREDLYFRLHIFPVRLPSLRDRPDDIPPLAAHFLAKHAAAHHRPAQRFEAAALRALVGYPWPGNVRELENAVERAVALAPAEAIELRHLPEEVREARAAPLPGELADLQYKDALEQARDRFSRDYLLALMRAVEGNVTRGAERAGIERESLHRLLRRHGIKSDDFKHKG
jgi:two-component system response regulator AtoC